MNTLPLDLIGVIFQDIPINSIINFIKATEFDRSYCYILHWFKSQLLSVEISNSLDHLNHISKVEFESIAHYASWKLLIHYKKGDLNWLDNFHIVSLDFHANTFVQFPPQAYSKLSSLTIDSIEQDQFDFAVAHLHNLSNLSVGCTTLKIDFSHDHLHTLSLTSGIVDLIHIPKSILWLKILATLNKVYLTSLINLATLQLGPYIDSTDVINFFHKIENLSKLTFIAKLPRQFLQSINWHNLFPSLQELVVLDGIGENLNIPVVRCHNLYGNQLGINTRQLAITNFVLNPDDIFEFLGDSLKIENFVSEDVNFVFDCDRLIAPRLKELYLQCRLSRFPSIPESIHSLQFFKTSFAALPKFDAFTNLYQLRIECDMDAVTINAPNLSILTINGTNIEKLYVNESLQHLNIYCKELKHLENISTTDNKFPPHLVSLIFYFNAIEVIENFTFPLSLKSLVLGYASNLKTIKNVTFDFPSQLEEFELNANLIYNNLVLPDTCKTVKLSSFGGNINLITFQLPKLAQNIELNTWGSYKCSQRVITKDNSFLDLQELKTLTLDGLNIKTTKDNPLHLPLSLEYLKITRNTTNEINLKFPAGYSDLRTVSLLYNFQELDDEFPLFSKYSFSSLGHANGTFHNNLKSIIAFIPPIDCDDCNRLSWGYYHGIWIELNEQIRNEIFVGNVPSNLMQIKILGPQDNDLVFTNPKFDYIHQTN